LLLSADDDIFLFRLLFNILFQLNHQIAWRFIFSAILISPFILLIITIRSKMNPELRSLLWSASFLGLFLPFQRSALYFSDTLYLFIRHTAKKDLPFLPKAFYNSGYDIFELISAIWFIGFLFFFIVRMLNYRKTVLMFRKGKLQTCASYFDTFRSRIYLPPNFTSIYSQKEQEMILAHEHQHIKQHDPFIFRFLAILESVCWFNPLVSIAVTHFHHERELLCDKKVIQKFSEHEYGNLILKETVEKRTALRAATAGIVINYRSTSERLFSMVNTTKTDAKLSTAFLLLLSLTILALGFTGFKPAWRSLGSYSSAIVEEELHLRELAVYKIENLEASLGSSGAYGELIEGMTEFVSVSKYGLSVDEKAMYDFAISLGLNDESCLRINHINGLHLDMGGGQTSFQHLEFKLGDLKTQEKYLDYTKDTDWFEVLTNIFI
jgi:beta-lactamase regulating signal transducer with metallopeptidase domain